MNTDAIRLETFYKNGYAANCNTCLHLERIKHQKNKFGFLQGICKSVPNIPRDYIGTPVVKLEEDKKITFHPNDWLLLPCHKQRDFVIKWTP